MKKLQMDLLTNKYTQVMVEENYQYKDVYKRQER